MVESITRARHELNADALDRLATAVQTDIDAGENFGAAMLLARRGEIVWRRELGTVAPGRPAADDDVYLLMSMSKGFTAALVLQAIDRGRLTFDDKVADLIPGFGVGGKQNATVLQLLTHTAGLPTVLIPPPLTPSEVGDLSRKADAIAAMDGVYEPGTHCRYTSGVGYDALGQILVNTDPQRRSFRRIAHEDLFAPLGMRDTSFGLPVDHPRRVPVSFTEKYSAPDSPIPPLMFSIDQNLDENAEFPAAAAYSTIADVLKFTEALQGRSHGFRMLSPAITEFAWSNHTGDLLQEATEALSQSSALPAYPANSNLLGGYVRGHGDYFNTAGYTASPDAITSVGGCSTAWLIDPQRDLTFIFLSAGFLESSAHFRRVQRLCDPALATVDDQNQ